jgi:hypothetical protein
LVFDDDINELKELATLYKNAIKENLESGGVKNIKKGDFFASYNSIIELQKDYQSLKNKISILEAHNVSY